MSGPTGVFYRQFSITMASSIVISGLVALTLTPVLCAMILKDTHGKPKKKNFFNRFLDGFNNGFEKMTGRYVWLMQLITSKRLITIAMLIIFSVGIFAITKNLPSRLCSD